MDEKKPEQQLVESILHDVKVILLDMPEHTLQLVQVEDSTFQRVNSVRVCFKNGDQLYVSLTEVKPLPQPEAQHELP